MAVPRGRATQVRKDFGDERLYGSWGRDGFEIRLVDIPAWRLAVLDPVPVPSRLTRARAVVRALQKERQPLGLTAPVQGRGLRLIQALITAAEAEGHTATGGALPFSTLVSGVR